MAAARKEDCCHTKKAASGGLEGELGEVGGGGLGEPEVGAHGTFKREGGGGVIRQPLLPPFHGERAGERAGPSRSTFKKQKQRPSPRFSPSVLGEEAEVSTGSSSARDGEKGG